MYEISGDPQIPFKSDLLKGLEEAKNTRAFIEEVIIKYYKEFKLSKNCEKLKIVNLNFHNIH